MKTRILAVLSIALLAVALLAGLERARGAAALSEAQAAEGRDDLAAAIAAARVAAEARVPYTHHADHALDLLERTAERARAGRDPSTAALALRVARQAAQATGQTEREERFRTKERELAADKKPDATFAQEGQKPSEPRATGTGRGPIGLGSQLGIALGVTLLTAALVLATRKPAVPARLWVGLSALGTVVLALVRLLA